MPAQKATVAVAMGAGATACATTVTGGTGMAGRVAQAADEVAVAATAAAAVVHKGSRAGPTSAQSAWRTRGQTAAGCPTRRGCSGRTGSPPRRRCGRLATTAGSVRPQAVRAVSPPDRAAASSRSGAPPAPQSITAARGSAEQASIVEPVGSCATWHRPRPGRPSIVRADGVRGASDSPALWTVHRGGRVARCTNVPVIHVAVERPPPPRVAERASLRGSKSRRVAARGAAAPAVGAGPPGRPRGAERGAPPPPRRRRACALDGPARRAPRRTHRPVPRRPPPPPPAETNGRRRPRRRQAGGRGRTCARAGSRRPQKYLADLSARSSRRWWGRPDWRPAPAQWHCRTGLRGRAWVLAVEAAAAWRAGGDWLPASAADAPRGPPTLPPPLALSSIALMPRVLARRSFPCPAFAFAVLPPTSSRL